MKKIYHLLVIALFSVFNLNAQGTCNASFTFGSNASNSAQIIFTNTSNSTISQAVQFTWYFGDGTTSTGSWNTTHTYQAAGTYPLTLEMKVIDSLTNNLLCSSYAYDTVVIASPASCTAGFQHVQTGPGSLTINFQSTGSSSANVAYYNTYDWNFGDGSTHGSGPNPSHTYAAAGNYNVSLIHEMRDSANNAVICSSSKSAAFSVGTIDSCGVSFSYSTNPNNLKAYFHGYGSARDYLGTVYPGTYNWDFGDGTTASGKFVSHTYSQAGTYQVSLGWIALNPATQMAYCVDSVFQMVLLTNPNPTCNASFYIDTAASGGNSLYIYNTSTPHYNNPNYQIGYLWDFGDGSTSTQPFPVHSYGSNSAYRICLTTVVSDSLGGSCTNTHCDTLGIDSLGNLYKNSSSGFTLNVLDPATVGQKEYELGNIQIYPNPASGELHIEGLHSEAKWYLYNLAGMPVARGHLQNSQKAIALPNVPNGLYLLRLNSGNGTKNLKLKIYK